MSKIMTHRQLILLVLLAPAWTPALAELVLREDTATQAVVIGPFVDSTDGNTAETGLTIDAADVRLSKNGANIVGKNSGGCTHDELGYYTCTFDATDSDTVGRLQVMVHESGALPVYHEFQVAEEAVYDACCASGAAPLAADGSSFTAIPWNASWDAEVQSEAADAINADTGDSFTAIPWNASWDAQVESEVTDGLNAYDPPTNAEMVARTLAAASYATAAMQTTIAAYIDTEIATLLNGVDVESINDVTITGDGSGTPFGVTP